MPYDSCKLSLHVANAPPSVQIPLRFGVPPSRQECFPAKGQQFNRFGRVGFVEGARCKLLGPRRAREWKRPLFCALGAWFCSKVFYFHHRIWRAYPKDASCNQFLPPNNLHPCNTADTAPPPSAAEQRFPPPFGRWPSPPPLQTTCSRSATEPHTPGSQGCPKTR